MDGLEQQRVYEWALENIEGYRSGSYLGQNSVFLQVDSTGLGVGVAKDFILNTKFVVTPIHFATMANDNRSYTNVRAEMYFLAARLYEKGIVRYFQSVGEQEIEDLHYQFSGVSYETDIRNDRKKIVSKDLIQQILGRSPDHADSYVLMCRGLITSEIDI
jgi:hypothetical protein